MSPVWSHLSRLLSSQTVWFTSFYNLCTKLWQSTHSSQEHSSSRHKLPRGISVCMLKGESPPPVSRMSLPEPGELDWLVDWGSSWTQPFKTPSPVSNLFLIHQPRWMDGYIIAFYWGNSLNFWFALHSAALLKFSLIHGYLEHKHSSS